MLIDFFVFHQIQLQKIQIFNIPCNEIFNYNICLLKSNLKLSSELNNCYSNRYNGKILEEYIYARAFRHNSNRFHCQTFSRPLLDLNFAAKKNKCQLQMLRF